MLLELVLLKEDGCVAGLEGRLIDIEGCAGLGVREQAVRDFAERDGSSQQNAIFELTAERRPECARSRRSTASGRFLHLTILLIVAIRSPRYALDPDRPRSFSG